LDDKKAAVVAIGDITLDEKSNCEDIGEYVEITETNNKGVEEKTTICKNKKGSMPKWFSARKVCVEFKTNNSAGKKNRIIEFNGGVMLKDAFKDVKKKAMKTLSGRKSVEVSQYDITAASLVEALRGKRCYNANNSMTKPMMKLMSADDVANKPKLTDAEKEQKKKEKDAKKKKKKSKKSKKKN